MERSQPAEIYGQGLSPWAYYRTAAQTMQAEGVVSSEVVYKPLETHGAVGAELAKPGMSALKAQDSTLIGSIQPSREAMPDVFQHLNIHAFGGVILDVMFEKMRHSDVDPVEIEHAVTMQVVAEQSSRNIAGLTVIRVADTGDAAIALGPTGKFTGVDTESGEEYIDTPCYAICTKEAGEDNGLQSDGIASNSRGATRFIAYENALSGATVPQGDRQLIALRVPHEDGALTSALVAGFEHVNLSGLAQLNTPQKHADFSVEIKGERGQAEKSIDLLRRNGHTARWLGAYSLIDARSNEHELPEFDPHVFATSNANHVSAYLKMDDSEGGLIERLKELKGVNLESIKIAERPEHDLTIGMVIDIDRRDLEEVRGRLNGNAVWLDSAAA